MTIGMMMLYGAMAGLVVGGLFSSQRLGCSILLAIPITMIVYVSRWQSANPEALRSTSGLDFVFGPLWPSIGALGGFYAARALRSALTKK
ncbi:hypothetical protein [Sphingobium xanthum]|jgi:hypothetical protein|uniref:hypothetical protein n=2 Tax=Sphingobium xanthum TaxID=1387165 RepID=UPI001C8C3B51